MASTIEATPVFPTLRYRDAPAMIDWLKRAFGLAEHVVYRGEDGTVAHAELTWGSGMIMCGSARDDWFARLVGTPESLGGTTQCIYLAVEDVDAHCARARAEGAEILSPPRDTDYGSRDYICRDPEGHVWCFGRYWPKAHEPAA